MAIWIKSKLRPQSAFVGNVCIQNALASMYIFLMKKGKMYDIILDDNKIIDLLQKWNKKRNSKSFNTFCIMYIETWLQPLNFVCMKYVYFS